MGGVEHDPGVVHASNLDRIVAYTRDTEALDRILREVDDDAHGNRRGFRVFRVFHFVGRCALTRQRQGLVRRLCRHRESGHHRCESSDACGSAEHVNKGTFAREFS